jgi:hypothetical protein
LPVATKFAGRDSGQSESGKALGKCVEETLAVCSPICALLLKLDDAMSDHPIPQRETDVNGFGGEVLGLMVDMDNRSYQ